MRLPDAKTHPTAMLTRFSSVTCPRCGHAAKPEVRGDAGALSLIPLVGRLAEVHAAATRTLHCRKCGEQLTEPIITKVQQAARTAKDRYDGWSRASAPDSAAASTCQRCGGTLAAEAKFCSGCGVPTASPGPEMRGP